MSALAAPGTDELLKFQPTFSTQVISFNLRCQCRHKHGPLAAIGHTSWTKTYMTQKNVKEAARKKSLGELGELFAIKALVDNEFDRVRNLNDKHLNEAFADIACEKNGKKYIISVKARNKFERDGKLNSRYKLGTRAYEKAAASEKKYKAKAHWIAIQFDRTSFSIYFGSLEQLDGRNAIPVDKCEKGELGEVWCRDKRHYFDFDFYTNKK